MHDDGVVLALPTSVDQPELFASAVTLITAYSPSWAKAGGAALVDSALGRTFNTAPRRIVPVTNRLTMDHRPERSIESLCSIPLQVRSSFPTLAKIATRFAYSGEPYGIGKYRAFRSQWKQAQAGLRQIPTPIVASSFLPLLLCHDSGRVPDLYVAHNVEWMVAKQADSPLPNRDWERLREAERVMVRGARQVVALSATDASRLSNLAQMEIPSLEWKFPRAPRTAKTQSSLPSVTVGYIGSGTWPPNRRDIEYLKELVLPNLRQRGLNVELLLAGRGTEQLASGAHVRALGEVGDVGGFYQQIDVVVIPRGTDATGVSIKAVEALGRGKPVIASQSVSEALQNPNGLFIVSGGQQLEDALADFVTGSAK